MMGDAPTIPRSMHGDEDEAVQSPVSAGHSPKRLQSRREFIAKAIAAGALASGSPLILPKVAFAEGRATRGGSLRVALIGGGNTETLDPHKAVARTDIARMRSLYDRLTDMAPDGAIKMTLAESLEPNKSATIWTARLKSDVTWHNGKPLVADDVIYSYRRILDKRNGLQGLADIGMILEMRKLDRRTVRFKLRYPYADFPIATAQFADSIIPAGTTNFAHPIGTGAFKFESFSVGQRSVFSRNEHYWQQGKPYVDQLVILSTSDPQARINALLSNQVDAIEDIPSAQVAALKQNRNVRVMVTKTAHWVPICLPCRVKPFTDNRVRLALRLCADRPQIVQQALLGYGWVGNDLFAPLDPYYARDIPQRHQDIDRARYLLKQAGYSDLSFTIYTADAANGMVESAVVYAQQAKAAGVNVKIHKSPADTYYNTYYLKGLVAQDDWNFRAIAPQIAQSVNRTSPYNETQWYSSSFDKLCREAAGTLNKSKRQDLYHDIQKQLWHKGGYIIWGFQNFVDAYQPHVKGMKPHVFLALGYYSFENTWLT